MTQLMDYCQDESMLFSDVYHDQVPGMTVDFPSPKAFRVGSYSGSDCDRQFQSFPTPPDSPVLAELTTQSGNNRQQQQQQQQQQPGKPSSSVPGNASAGEVYRQPKPPTAGYFLGEPNRLASDNATHGMMPSMELDLTLLEDLLHSSSMAEQLGQDFGDTHFQNSLNHPCTETGPKPDFADNFSQFTPDSPMNMTSSMFPSGFTDAFDDCTIPSPAPSPSPITVADIFAGDLPNLDDLSLVSEFAQMESSALSMSTNPRPFGATSSGEESDIESESSYSLPLDDLQSTFTNMNSQMTPAMLSHPPPPLYHEHHHNIQSYHQFNHHGNHHHSHPPNHPQQQSQTQHPYAQMYGTGMQGASAANGRTHNYQCRTLHTTIKMLDTHADGVVTQDSAPQQQPSCAGPIRKPFRARPRKQSVASSDDGCSDEEHIVTTTTVAGGNGVTSSPNRNRGRGRREAMKGNHLWEFIRDLLKSESYCPKFIRWEDRESGVFRFVNSEAVATMWGRKKNNPQMTYEKLSRAMRYYYKREILERVDGRRLVYKFGKNAEGWREAAGLQ